MDMILVISVLLAFIVKGMSGFANTLVFGTLMSFNTNTINITPVDLLLGFPTNMLIVYKERKSLDPKVYVPLSILVVLGIIPGAFFLKNGDTQVIKLIFGIVVALISLEMFLRDKQVHQRKSSRFVLIGIGIVSGILCGLFGVGAFLVAYISRTTTNMKQFRGNICAVFLVENIFRIILYSMTGILSVSIFIECIKLIPVVIVGLSIGIFLSNKFSEKIIKNIVIVVLLLSGISLVINNIV
jgi:hypothetical protein